MTDPFQPGPSLPPVVGARDPGGRLEHLLFELSGFKIVPGRVVPRPNPLIITYLAPQPVGFVPPRFFGLPEDYFFGFTAEEVLRNVGAEDDPERQQQYADLIINKQKTADLQQRVKVLKLGDLYADDLLDQLHPRVANLATSRITEEREALAFEFTTRPFARRFGAVEAIAQERGITTDALIAQLDPRLFGKAPLLSEPFNAPVPPAVFTGDISLPLLNFALATSGVITAAEANGVEEQVKQVDKFFRNNPPDP